MALLLLSLAACCAAIALPNDRRQNAPAVSPSTLTPPATVAGQVIRTNISYEPDFPTASANAQFSHVIFLSIDGMHQSDLEYYVNANPNSAFAALVAGGVQYTNASTSTPSDSFPGTAALVTGGSPRSAGIYYDVAYARDLFDPTNSNCTGPSGAAYAFDETLDLNSTTLSGGGGFNISMFNYALNSVGRCVQVYPHDFLQVNTIFEVARFAGYHTAYTDKHPAYEFVNGPSGIGLSQSYFPEINAGSSLAFTEGYDQLHWSALTNWTFGQYYNGTAWPAGTPNLYGGNFQSVSVAQKTYGYTNNGTVPSTNLTQAIDYTDAKLGAFIQSLKDAGIYQQTLLIVTAKHGQSPKDLSKRKIIDDSGLQASTSIQFAGYAADDGAYIWLNNYDDAAQVKADLLANATALGIAQVFAGYEVAVIGLGDPKYSARAPDVVVRSNPGVIYASPKATKVAEHGGFNSDDLAVPLVVHNPTLEPCTVSGKVNTRQVAATALYALGLDPFLLQAAQLESTLVLPQVFK